MHAARGRCAASGVAGGQHACTHDVGGCRVVISSDGRGHLPDGITRIPDFAFYKCTSLLSLDLPAGVTSIGDEAFHGCASLTYINLPAGLASIGFAAFRGCSCLTTLSFSDGLLSIGFGAFMGCSALTRVDLPASVATVGLFAFTNCSSLGRVVAPSTADLGDLALTPGLALIRLPPARLRAQQRILFLGKALLAYRRCRPLLYGWLERAQLRLGAYGPDGAARRRDQEEFEGDFPMLLAGPAPSQRVGAHA